MSSGSIRVALATCATLLACHDPVAPLATAAPGVVFSYPRDGQVDVPLGSRVLVTFSEPVVAAALGGAIGLVGPDGPIDTLAEIVNDGRTVQLATTALEPGTTYGVVVGHDLDPIAQNLPVSGPLFAFTTRAQRPRAAVPRLVAIDGLDPAMPESLRPLFETSTLRLVFSEPLDPRTVELGARAIELVDATGAVVPATLLASGIHVSIDPVDDLVAGAAYELRLGDRLRDLGGQALVPSRTALRPRRSRPVGAPTQLLLRTRGAEDPGPSTSRTTGAPNGITVEKPLVGTLSSQLAGAVLAAELGDPQALDGPIAVTLRRGQRLRAQSLDVALGGRIPLDVSTGEIVIELLSDAGGLIYRNAYQPADQRPETERAPLFVDLSLDLAVFSVDPVGNKVLSQTVLGVQATGTAVGSDGVLAIEVVATLELGILGVTSAPTNLALELITDPGATIEPDRTPPSLVTTSPAEGSRDLAVEAGVELIFDEPIDLDRARAGGIRLEDGQGRAVATTIESHGAGLVLRPLASLARATAFRVVLDDVADLAGNALGQGRRSIAFTTSPAGATTAPLTVVAVRPGVPCALTGGTPTTAGRCAGGGATDERYQPFAFPADQPAEVIFNQPPDPATIVLGAACGQGSVRVEQVDASGACVAAVPGTLLRREQSIAFVPDLPWRDGGRYRLSLISGTNGTCNAGEICGVRGPASFDPLTGVSDGGPNLVIDFAGAPPNGGTFVFLRGDPYTDVDGSGTADLDEPVRDENRAALRIVGTTGAIGTARFVGADCVASTPEPEACLYLQGAMPITLGALEHDCPLPDGSVAATCMPVTVEPGVMYGTSVTLEASVGITITTATRAAVLRVRGPGGGAVTGYAIDDAGVPTIVVTLELYLDAPDMDVPLSSHDLHSKPLSVALRGPIEIQPDGRVAIVLHNVEDVPLAVAIDAPLGISGSVRMVVPKGEMRLQLASSALRGGPR